MIEPVGGGRVRVAFTLADADTAARLVGVIAAGGDEMTDFDVASPSLDDVFFHLATTGGPT